MNSTSLRFAALLALVPALPLAAQEHEHGFAEQVGHVTFPVSCNAEAQRHFEHGMALLHSFWWDQASAAFRTVAAADSTCAMAYWGLALNSWGNPFAGGPTGDNLQQGKAAAERAMALGAPTARERGLLAAAGALYRDYETVPNASRLQAYSDTLRRVYRAYPGDAEVAMYYALSLIATASPADTTLARQKRAAAILNPLFRRFPEHPGLAHYLIHANDSPRLASLGLEAARRYAQIAPAAPHALHMPSHIFVRLGLWDETIEANKRAFEAGVTFAHAQHLQGVAPEQFHALDYYVYACLQTGRDSLARQAVVDGLKLATLGSGAGRGWHRRSPGAVRAWTRRRAERRHRSSPRRGRRPQRHRGEAGGAARLQLVWDRRHQARGGGRVAAAGGRRHRGRTARVARGSRSRGPRREAPRDTRRAPPRPRAGGGHAGCRRALRGRARRVRVHAQTRAAPGPQRLRGRAGGGAGRRHDQRAGAVSGISEADAAGRSGPRGVVDREGVLVPPTLVFSLVAAR